MPVQLVALVARTGQTPVRSDLSRRQRARAARLDETAAEVLMPAPVPARPAGSLLHPVLEGESAADIAQHHGVSTASLLAANGLSWRSTLTPGLVLTVPITPTTPAAGRLSEDLQRHAVQHGETAASIAFAHGVPTAAVLLANGLSRSSRLFAGQQLVIPLPGPGRAPSGEPLVLTGEMHENAAAVVAAGRLVGVPDEALVIALTAAMQDSSLRNLDFGERMGVGLFHRRPGTGWGSRTELLDPEAAAVAFFGGDGRGAPGLLDLDGWALMSVGEAANAVQRGPGAHAYAKWEDCARTWVDQLAGGW